MGLHLGDLRHFALDAIGDRIWFAQNVELDAQFTIILLQLLLALTQRIDIFCEPLMVLLGGLGRLLELLILRPVVFQYCDKLLFLFDLELSLLLISLDLLFELLGLSVNLSRQGVLDPARLAILLA